MKKLLFTLSVIVACACYSDNKMTKSFAQQNGETVTGTFYWNVSTNYDTIGSTTNVWSGEITDIKEAIIVTNTYVKFAPYFDGKTRTYLWKQARGRVIRQYESKRR